MAVTKAHIKASNKYNKENYSKIQANISKSDYQIIDDFCKSNNISKSIMIVNCCRYCIDNNIDIVTYTPFNEQKNEK